MCTYNLMLTVPVPLRYNGQRERSARICGSLHLLAKTHTDIDVFVFQELTTGRSVVVEGMAELGWPYASDVLTTPCLSCAGTVKLLDGGVVIVSKYPITHQRGHVFRKACQGYDCLACKGSVLCRIVKEGNVVNILGTHLQAWDNPRSRRVREVQATEIRELIDSASIPKDEPVVVLGDFNIDLNTNRTEIDMLRSTLYMSILDHGGVGVDGFSSDPKTNQLVGNDDGTMYKTTQYPHGCYADYMDSLHCPCCPREWLDFVGFSRGHLNPIKSAMHIHPLKSTDVFKMQFNLKEARYTTELSDHYPVLATLFFEDTPFADRPAPWRPIHRSADVHPQWACALIPLVVLFVSLCITGLLC